MEKGSDNEMPYNRPGLIKHKLFEHGGDPVMVNWYYNFITHMNLQLDIINSYGAFANGFADDCVTMITGKNLKAMMNNLQKVVNKLEAWGNTAGLKFNSSKTEVVIFTKKRLKQKKCLKN